MLLFVKIGSEQSEQVLAYAEKNGITFFSIKKSDEPGVIDELIERGGKAQFPYFVDVEEGIEMYDADDIIDYLEQKYSGTGGSATQSDASMSDFE